jgi:hypothetical protein
MFGPAHQIPITPNYGGKSIVLTFHVDRTMFVRSYFDAWMHMITMPAFFSVNYRSVYLRNIWIRQLDENDDGMYEMMIRECYPQTMEMMPLHNADAPNTHRLTVSFAYRYWETTLINHSFARGTVAPSLTGGNTASDIYRGVGVPTTLPTATGARFGSGVAPEDRAIYDAYNFYPIP